MVIFPLRYMETTTKENFEQALFIIEKANFVIDYLGGDSYEMEATEKIRNEINDFLDKHKTKEEIKPVDNISFALGYYIDRNSPERGIIKAVNKRNAKNIFNIPICNVKCIKQPNSEVFI